MGRQNNVNRIRHKEVCVFRIGLMHVYYSMYFYYLLLFVIHMVSLDNLGDLLIYFSLSVIRIISAALFYAYHIVVVLISKWLAD